MIDIASKLFPNILTIITQLCASLIIYIMYKKHIHEHVIRYLKEREVMMREATEKALAVEKEAALNREKIQEERALMKKDLESYRLTLERKAKREYQDQVKAASVEIARRNEAAIQQINKEKNAMLQEVKEHAIEIAYAMSSATLQDLNISETDTLNALERKLDEQ